MYKYRYIDVDCEPCDDKCFLTRVVQVKKWYGWTTFYSIEGEYSWVVSKTDDLIKFLNNV